ncbi:MAG: lipid II:glycine glycyltransferase FemX [Candidatus Saccharimonadales bacterium]
MNTRYATDQEIRNWNDLIVESPNSGNILQGKEFMEQKAESGWTIRYLMDDLCAIAIMEKTLPLFGKIWYCPKGPCIATKEELTELLPRLQEFAHRQGVISLKIEPELDHAIDMSKLGLYKTKPIQYNYATVLIDLSPPLDDILKSLNQKGRHAIRRAERDGVIVKQVEINDENTKLMYELFKETSEGAGFVIRPYDYYRRFYERYGDNGGLFFAYYEEQVVAGAFAMVFGSKSIYKDGASIRKRTAYGASHLLQWRVIEWAKSKGSRQHDLAGVPPIVSIRDDTHPFYGLGRFKTSFNKTVTEFVGTYNLPVAQRRGLFWHNYLENVVRKAYFMIHKESWY